MVTKLFVGFSGPIGYDYWKGGGRPLKASTPNAVLEDVTGLLLCYDELYFLSRDFCPKDMWHLSYVKFLSDDSKGLSRAVVAYEQAVESLAEFGRIGQGNISGTFAKTISTMVGPNGFGGIDNHTRGLADADGFNRSGNSADADAVLIDRLIAASLEVPNLDVLTNTVASEVIKQSVVMPSPPGTFTDWHVDVASVLGSVRVPNLLGPEGGYHEDVEQLRAHPQVLAFRKYLGDLHPGEGPPEDAAKAVSDAAEAYASQSLQKAHGKKSIYHTIGRGAIGPLLDIAVPSLGTAISGVLDISDSIKGRRNLRKSAWASFVVSIKK